MSVQRYKLTLAYDGTAYHGWQSQASGMGVQDRVEAALALLFRSAPRVQGSSRTDAGVHAYGMVAHLDLAADELRMPLRHLPLAINACLPDDIRVRSAVKVAAGFHARFDATGKEYRYHIWNHAVMNPLLRGRAWHVPRPLDLPAMRSAAEVLTGRHDFRAFTANRGGELADAVRTLTRCEVRRSAGGLVITLEAGGFLYKMCRGIAGTLVQVGEGRFRPDDVRSMLASGDRRMAGVNAPAHGLVLQRVSYRKR